MPDSSSHPQPPSGREPHQPKHDLSLPLESLADPLPVPPLATSEGRGHFQVALQPPGSKSLTNRAILLAALADGESTLFHPLLGADDCERMLDAVETLGASTERRGTDSAAGDHLRIRGVGGRWHVSGDGTLLNLNNAGTATRFLAAAALLSPAPLTIDGNARMRQRPIGELGNVLEELGARVEYLEQPDAPPVRITPPAELPTAPRLEIGTTASSQFISALLLIAPWLPGGMTLLLDDEITSRSYIEMTLGLLDQLGAVVKTSEDLRIIRIGAPAAHGGSARAGLPAFHCSIEPDASSATYFWAAAALFPGSACRIDGIGAVSLQPDAHFPQLLSRMGAHVASDDEPPSITVRGPRSLSALMADLSLMPDSAMTLAVVACFAEGRSVLRGLHTLRVKETDRIDALKNELTRLGVLVDSDILGDRDTLTITPPPGGIDCSPSAPRIEFDTYDDHRMAMALSLVGLRRPNTFIRGPRCVAKTYPNFWSDLARLY